MLLLPHIYSKEWGNMIGCVIIVTLYDNNMIAYTYIYNINFVVGLSVPSYKKYPLAREDS